MAVYGTTPVAAGVQRNWYRGWYGGVQRKVNCGAMWLNLVCRYICHPETGCRYDTLCGGSWQGEESELKLMEGWGTANRWRGGEAPQYLHFLLCSTDKSSSDFNSMGRVRRLQTDFAGMVCSDVDTIVHYVCANITVHWSILIWCSFYNTPKFKCVQSIEHTEHVVLTRTHKTQLLQSNLFLSGISTYITAEVTLVFVSRQQYCLQALGGRTGFLVGVQCQRCNCTCGTRVSCDALLRILLSRTEVTSLNSDLELADGVCSHSGTRLPLALLCFVLFSALTGERGRRHRVLLKIGLLWDVAPWLGGYEQSHKLACQGQAGPSCRTAASSGGRTTIARNVAICDPGSTALHPNGR